MALSLSACGGGSGGTAKDSSSSSSSSSASSGAVKDGASKGGGGKTFPDKSKVLGTFKGPDGIDLVVHAATRDSGGFLTVYGEFKNTSSEDYTVPIAWQGLEQSVAMHGRSLGAMTLVDSKERKRYYILRDSDDRPLTTTDYADPLKAKASMDVFAMFPAPPASTTEVGIQFPGFAAGTIEVS
ncbi:hypothetical protein [Streptomyces sp. NPDC057010]|uniref:hypothetical protein n=1 Tax=Streptomyces sp. NPDC057010 TaxID=3345997 RepID=UPI003632A3CD